jgi:heme/copper-type cytochrome/quinol oxidase subunit 4
MQWLIGCIAHTQFPYFYQSLSRNAMAHRLHRSHIGLARTTYIQCVYSIFGREIIKYTVFICGSDQPYSRTFSLLYTSFRIATACAVMAHRLHRSHLLSLLCTSFRIATACGTLLLLCLWMARAHSGAAKSGWVACAFLCVCMALLLFLWMARTHNWEAKSGWVACVVLCVCMALLLFLWMTRAHSGAAKSGWVACVFLCVCMALLLFLWMPKAHTRAAK